MSQHPLEDIFHPESIAIAGVSKTGYGGYYLSALLKFGFKGKIYPIHPKYQEVLGVKCFPDMRDVPGKIDYVISSIPATQVLSLIDNFPFDTTVAFFCGISSISGKSRSAYSDLLLV